MDSWQTSCTSRSASLFANFTVLENSNDETNELDFDCSFRAGDVAVRLRPRHAITVAGSERFPTNSYTIAADPERAAAQHDSEHFTEYERYHIELGWGRLD
jgi:hypothetical protein